MVSDSSDHTFNPKILREYDIRGTVGQTLSTKDAYLLGRRFGQMMRKNRLKTVSVGRDGRLSSPDLTAALMDGLIETGAHIYDVGIGPTPMLYFSVKHLKTDAGIMVTGSHNPPEDNGFKMTLGHRPFFGQDIQNLAVHEADEAYTGGRCEAVSIDTAYTERLLQDYKPGRRLKVAWDPGNGAAGEIVQSLIDSGQLAVDSVAINTTIDGTFPAHHPDPTVPENLAQLQKVVHDHGCDLGIAFDGDGDRIGVIDGQGRILWGDQLMILWSRDVLSRHPGATIIADVKASQVLFDDIQQHKGRAIMARTGHSLIKTKIAETKALLAGEMSGHIFFNDDYYGYDDAIYAAIRLLNILHHSDKKLTQLFDELPKCINTPEIRIDCPDDKKFHVVASIQVQLHHDGVSFDDVDGVRVQTKEGWWLLRASNTQAILVARAESKTQEGLETLLEQLQSYMEPFGLKLP
ncbi:phosphomannomutase/phosphoglucomutase [Candidatus Finniella inopinata]|uniref:Phosphomannomutase/phosphoglucomutase n=1 Tax=Candidatus Finniella inopinata TaxID=1696036 RepID=A0A4Q7DL40_9PROT|nr:phosphomannomutase/phosphoglucomutase [Candidatus Finniella inopinata]RZI46955.1 phosphomannomutase/phosphoglucomutase [Candidatus Finniella inopinata]